MSRLCLYCHDVMCFVDRHHLYWPRRAYRTSLERKFRGMYVKKMWRCQHNKIHTTTLPPRKPSRIYMQHIVDTRKGVNQMMHRINGCPVNLRTATDEELAVMILNQNQRIADAQDDKEKLVAEVIRRSDNIHQLHFEYEGPSVA